MKSCDRMTAIRRRAIVFLVTVGAFLSVAQFCSAEIATDAEMRQVAENCLVERVYLQGEWAESTAPSLAARHELRSNDTLLAVWYDIAPRGFVLVPVLKEMVPVKAYSTESNLDDRQEGGLLQMLREVLSFRLSLYGDVVGSIEAPQPKGDGVFGHGQRLLWDTYTLPAAEFQKALFERGVFKDTEAGPLVTTSWHQNSPYNNLAPIGNGGRSVVGCVATAAAQVLAFWQWPAQGWGDNTYVWDGDNSCSGSTAGSTQSAVFSDAYDWANMPDSCDGGCTSAQNEALAELSYELGVAHHMDYGYCGSGAEIVPTMNLMPINFRYSPAVRLVMRRDYTLPGWYQLIQQEIDAGRVINYAINTHEIVCDGYRENGSLLQYHMNYGWGGSQTLWFSLDSLYCGWVAGSICPADQDRMFIGIEPQTEPWLEIKSYRLTEVGDGDGLFEPGETVQVFPTLFNKGADASEVTATLQALDPYIEIGMQVAQFGADILHQSGLESGNALEFDMAYGCPNGHVAVLQILLESSGGYSTLDTVLVRLGTQRGFSDNTENGAGNWRHGRLMTNYVDQWHLETQRAHSGASAWKAGGTGSAYYSAGSDGCLITPPFLVHDSEAVLTFWHWLSAEEDSDPSQAWDGAVLMISEAGGDWELLTPTTGYTHEMYDHWVSPLPVDHPMLSGYHEWEQMQVDLSTFAGRQVRVMFRLCADGGTEYEGWYVDDVTATGFNVSCCVGPSVGNIDGSADNSVTMGDLTVLIDHLFISYSDLACVEEANVDMSADELVTMGDLTVLVDHLFISYNSLPACP